MIVKSSATLKQFRGPGFCGLCGVRCAHREPHHHVRKGLGGGTRLDIRDNLIALGGRASRDEFPECKCHDLLHDGKLPGGDARVLELIARREGWPSPEALDEYLTWLAQTATKWTSPEEVQAKRAELRRKAA